jgi:muconolactone delta-isomerase
MDYLVQMTLADSSRPASTTLQQGITFIEQFILPTLELCSRLAKENTILAGGPVSGNIALALIVRAESVEKLDQLIGSLPVWPFMNTTVTPLTTFENRAANLKPRLESLKLGAQSAKGHP